MKEFRRNIKMYMIRERDVRRCVFPLLTVNGPSRVMSHKSVTVKAQADENSTTTTILLLNELVSKRQLTDADWRILVVVTIDLTDYPARSRHTITWVSQAIIFNHRSGYGRVGRKAEATIVDDGRLETVDSWIKKLEHERYKITWFPQATVTNYLRSHRGGGPFQRPSTSQIKSPRPMSW